MRAKRRQEGKGNPNSEEPSEHSLCTRPAVFFPALCKMVEKKAVHICPLICYQAVQEGSLLENEIPFCSELGERRYSVYKLHLREWSKNKLKGRWSKFLTSSLNLSWNELQFWYSKSSHTWVRPSINLDKYLSVSSLANLESPHFLNRWLGSII